MPVRFRCTCGKALAAKEEFAGRRIRCPECQRVVTIPEVEPREPPLKMPRREPDRFEPTPVVKIGSRAREPVSSQEEIAMPPVTNAEVDLNTPTTRSPYATRTMPAPAGPRHPWIDASLVQTETPWLPGDEAKYQANVRRPREREGVLGWLVPLLLIAGLVFFAFTS